MILLMGIPSEPPLALVINAAVQAGIPYALLNQRDAPFADIVIHNRFGRISGSLRVSETEYALADFSGVYVRLMDHQHLPENMKQGILRSEDERVRKSCIFHDLVQIWLELATCRVMNRGSDMASNLSKPYQAQLIKAAGFAVPETMITNDIETVKKFRSRHGRVVFKSISSVRSIVRELRDVALLDLGKVRNLPTQFQVYIPGSDVRVHVVGDVLFATEVKCAAVDYRYARQDGHDIDISPVELPEAIRDRCFTLSHNLSLPLCGIDLRRTPDDEYFCLEVNPCPGYSYYQEQTGQNIALAIARYLEYGSAR